MDRHMMVFIKPILKSKGVVEGAIEVLRWKFEVLKTDIILKIECFNCLEESCKSDHDQLSPLWSNENIKSILWILLKISNIRDIIHKPFKKSMKLFGETYYLLKRFIFVCLPSKKEHFFLRIFFANAKD